MDCSSPGSSVCGIFQARILEWIAISFSRGSSQPRDWTHVSCMGRLILYHWATWATHLLVHSINVRGVAPCASFYGKYWWCSSKLEKDDQSVNTEDDCRGDKGCKRNKQTGSQSACDSFRKEAGRGPLEEAALKSRPDWEEPIIQKPQERACKTAGRGNSRCTLRWARAWLLEEQRGSQRGCSKCGGWGRNGGRSRQGPWASRKNWGFNLRLSGKGRQDPINILKEHSRVETVEVSLCWQRSVQSKLCFSQ